MSDAAFVIMGLPASGKTTFLAALWHLVEANEVSCKLRLDSYEGDLAYLNAIAEAWRTFRKVPRTSQSGDVDVTMRLIDRDTGARAQAFFPDLAGEIFHQQVEARRCRQDFVDGLANDDGILFFLSADVHEDGLTVMELNARMPDFAIDAASGGDGDADSADPVGMIEWEPRHLPTQVRVVQILSDLLQPPFVVRRRRLAIMVSAWDLARDMGLSPDAWLAVHMPLLHQFLRSNADAFETVVFGVSAQGVSLDDTAAVDRAAALVPSRRIQIIGPEGDMHDLTLPLVWLMAGGRAPAG